MKPVCKEKIVIGFAISEEKIKQLDNLAKNNGLSRSEYLRSLVIRHLEEKEE